MIGPEMVHLMELPNPDPLEGRPEVREAPRVAALRP